ncbi:MAG: hypothetical protein QM791_19435 [Ferruginibacter sp.]
MKNHLLFVLLALGFKTAVGGTGKPYPNLQYIRAFADTSGNETHGEDSVDTKIIFSSGGNNLEFVPLSSFNNGLLIQPVNRQTSNAVPVSFYSGSEGSWSFYTNAAKRLSVDPDGYIRTLNSTLLINGATPDESYAMKVHGNAGFDSSIYLGEVSDSTSFISMNMGFKSTFEGEDDKRSAYTSTPTTWAAGKKLPVFRLRHPTNVALGRSNNTSTAKDFMILPYQYGMAIEYNGVVECWVGEWSIHRGDFYNDAEGQGNGWGGILWVGDDQDGGGIRATARNNLFRGGNVNYGELSVEKFFGTPNGDFRFRLPSTDNQFHFVYGGRGSTNIVAKVSDKGFVIPKNSPVSVLNPEKGQVYFDSTASEFKGYNGSEWVNLTNTLVTGSDALSSDGISTFYQIPHSLEGSIPSYFNVIATSADAGRISYVTADENYLKIYYASAPPAGVNNLSWNWQIKK